MMTSPPATFPRGHHLQTMTRGHAALRIATALIPPSNPIPTTLSARTTILAESLTTSSQLLDEEESLKERLRWTEEPQSYSHSGDNVKALLREHGKRILDLLGVVHDWLDLPNQVPGSFGAKELLLEMNERSVLQNLISLVPTRLALPLIHHHLPTSSSTSSSLETLEPPTLLLLSYAHPHSQTHPRPHLSPLTQNLLNPSIIPFILLPSLLLGWSQSHPPARFTSIRKKTLEILEQFDPGRSLSVLNAVSGLISPPSASSTSTSTSTSTSATSPTAHGQRARITAIPDEPPTYPGYVKRTVRVLMGRQLVRRTGIRGLLGNVFGWGVGAGAGAGRGAGKGGDDVLDLRRLEYVTKLIGVPVVGMDPGDYYRNVFNQLHVLLVPPSESDAQNTPMHHVRAAGFIMTSLSTTSPEFRRLLKEVVHDPLFPNLNSPSTRTRTQTGTRTRTHTRGGRRAITSAKEITHLLSLLLPLLTLNPPSPSFIHLILGPIIRPLFLLWTELQTDPTADPLTREQVREALGAWTRLGSDEMVLKGLWGVVMGGRSWGGESGEAGTGTGTGEGLFWAKEEGEEVGMAVFYGEPGQLEERLELELETTVQSGVFELAIRPPEDDEKTEEPLVRPEEDDTLPPDLLTSSGIKLYPDPEAFVEILERSERKAVIGKIFVRCLQVYQESSLGQEENPVTSLLYLQIIMRLSEKVSSHLGKETQDVLLFIEHALRSSRYEHVHEEDEADSDDEDIEDVEAVTGDDVGLTEADVPNLGLTETALTLLLATLQGDPNLNPTAQPILKVIEKHTERLTRHRLPSIRQVAREASLLMTVRQALPSSSTTTSTQTSVGQRYQEALKLLQDPILAVRGHGLILLQQIVLEPEFDRAYTPAIMDIFLSALKDDDSFLYLNAVRGLSSLVDALGKDVLKGIVAEYADGLQSGVEIEGAEMDRRLRLGEALQQAVRRCGTALPGYVDAVVPRLNQVFPNTNLPTVLRSSSLSILATCAETDWKALLPWSNDLVGACLDLLRLESSPASQRTRKTKQPNDHDEHNDEDNTQEQKIEREPTISNDNKHPVLRRAALFFLGLLFDAVAKANEDQIERQVLQPNEIRMSVQRQPSTTRPTRNIDLHYLQAAQTVLGYIKHTDTDTLAAHQAGEVLQILQRIRQAM